MINAACLSVVQFPLNSRGHERNNTVINSIFVRFIIYLILCKIALTVAKIMILSDI